jgi:hypothetical protein
MRVLKVVLAIVPSYKYREQPTSVASRTGIEELTTSRTAQVHAICERHIESLKRRCPDQMLIFHRNPSRRVVKECADSCNPPGRIRALDSAFQLDKPNATPRNREKPSPPRCWAVSITVILKSPIQTDVR